MAIYQFRSSSSDYNRGYFMTSAVKTLIIINVAVFVLINLFRAYSLIYIFGMVPQLVLKKFMIWQLVTYMFVHVQLWHLLVNMLMLWFFGPAIEQAWGRNRFLFYYFFTGIGAALCSFIFAFDHSIIGASGAIFGLLVAYAIMFPETIILVFFLFPMKIKHAIILFAAINFLGAMQPSGGIAYFAHLGGALFGYLYLKSEWVRRRLSYLSLANLKEWWIEKDSNRRQSRQEEFNKEVDRILDKISKQGMKSLTRAEKEILDKKSKIKN
jgi:membrane associated rhomboid family serine protease